MIKKIVVFLFLLSIVLFLCCAHSNPVASSRGDSSPSPDDAVKQVVDLRNGGNSIKGVYYDTIDQIGVPIGYQGRTDYASVYLPPDITSRIFLDELNDGALAKKLSGCYDLFDFRKNSVNVLTLQFATLGSGDRDTFEFHFYIVDGKCSTNVVRIPLGYKYEVLTSLWFVEDYPWSWNSYKIYDRSFSGLDTIDMLSKNSDTLNVIFYESLSVKFFIAFERPPGVWTQDSSYTVYLDSLPVPAMYKDDTLFCHYLVVDMEDGPPYALTMDCDTGRVAMYFYPPLRNMADDGIVEVSSRKQFEGYLSDDTTNLFTDLPERGE